MRPGTATPVAARLATLAALLVAGCATSPPPKPPATTPAPAATVAAPTLPPPVAPMAPSAPPSAPASAPAAAPTPAPVLAVAAPLAHEQRWLSDLFKDTPVHIAAGQNGDLRVEVPLKYAFDAGQPAIKPPLGAVLDKVAASLNRLPRARVQVAAPATERVAALRNALVARGVAAYRIDRLPERTDAVELRLLAGPAAIGRLDDTARR